MNFDLTDPKFVAHFTVALTWGRHNGKSNMAVTPKPNLSLLPLQNVIKFKHFFLRPWFDILKLYSNLTAIGIF